MAVFVIPTSPGVPHYEQETELDGVAYLLTFEWLQRAEAWYITIADIEGAVIRAGIKLVPNWPLMRKVRHASRPPGELMVLAPAGTELTLDNFGVDAVLLYADAESVAEAASG